MNNSDIGRYNNYDLLRIISIIAVVFIHSNWIYFNDLYDTPETSFNWIFLSLMNIVTRFSVPAFVMISGAFILPNERNLDAMFFYKKILKRVYLPTCICIVFFTIIHIFNNLVDGREVYDGFKSVIIGSFYNLWFVYMLAGLYFLTPVIIRLKKTITWKHYKLISVMWIIWAVISQATSKQLLAYNIGVVFAFLAYYLIGDIIRTEIERGWNPNKWCLLFISLMCVAISFICRKFGLNYYTYNAYLTFFSPTVVIYSVNIFTLFSVLKIKKDYSNISSLVFFIYLFHTMIMQGLWPIINDIFINPIIGELMTGIATMIVSCFVSIMFRILWKRVEKSEPINSFIDNMRLWNWVA